MTSSVRPVFSPTATIALLAFNGTRTQMQPKTWDINDAATTARHAFFLRPFIFCIELSFEEFSCLNLLFDFSLITDYWLWLMGSSSPETSEGRLFLVVHPEI